MVFTNKPLRIHIKHTTENLANDKTAAELKELQEEMLKENPKEDDEFDKLGEIVAQVNEVMGGSDR
jgi:hypothetical protein